MKERLHTPSWVVFRGGPIDGQASTSVSSPALEYRVVIDGETHRYEAAVLSRDGGMLLEATYAGVFAT